jgi:hypothetical protein
MILKAYIATCIEKKDSLLNHSYLPWYPLAMQLPGAYNTITHSHKAEMVELSIND